MNHPPNVQLDAFGVWGVEIDVGVVIDSPTGIAVAVVGHDRPGDGICPGLPTDLIPLLVTIRDTAAMRYRPVFIYFEIKDGGDWTDFYTSNRCIDHGLKRPLVIQAMEQVFPGKFIDLYEYLGDNNGRYPTVPEMAGRAIIYYPKPEFTEDGEPPDISPDACRGNPPFTGTLESRSFDECTSNEVIRQLPPQVFRVDQYQADWTFDYGVPPNPLVVDSNAQPPYTAPASEGHDWGSCDNGDVAYGEVIAEQGTFSFPFRTVGRAVNRAQGTTPNGLRQQMRSGFGWTALVRPGTYLESVRIDIRLTLKKDDGPGSVVIIGQPGRMIRSVWISFRTTFDNKDDDTGVLVQMSLPNGRVLARYEQMRNKEYRQLFTHTEQLQLLGPVLERDLAGTILTIDISPNGSDTWEFEYTLEGTWSDGSPFSDRQFFISLDENATHFEKALNL